MRWREISAAAAATAAAIAAAVAASTAGTTRASCLDGRRRRYQTDGDTGRQAVAQLQAGSLEREAPGAHSRHAGGAVAGQRVRIQPHLFRYEQITLPTSSAMSLVSQPQTSLVI